MRVAEHPQSSVGNHHDGDDSRADIHYCEVSSQFVDFGIRVWLAMILALFVSFWLQLEAPASAAVNSFCGARS